MLISYFVLGEVFINKSDTVGFKKLVSFLRLILTNKKYCFSRGALHSYDKFIRNFSVL